MWKTARLITATALLGVSAVASFGGVAHADGGGNTSVALTGGSLTATGGAPGTFSATLNGTNQTVYTTLDQYTVTDATGSAAGWNITAQATQFTCVVGTDAGCQTGFTTLPASSLVMGVPSAACATTCTGTPAASILVPTAVDAGSAVKVLAAAAGSGTHAGVGSFTVTPGALTSGQLSLAVPANALATTYHSTLTITVNSGP